MQTIPVPNAEQADPHSGTLDADQQQEDSIDVRFSQLAINIDSLVDQHSENGVSESAVSVSHRNRPAAYSTVTSSSASPLARRRSNTLTLTDRQQSSSPSTTSLDPVAPSTLPDELKQAKIMIVDDEVRNIQVVRQFLRHEGYEQFMVTSDLRMAMELIRREMPDVILLDITTPVVNGFDMLRVARLDAKLAHVPIIIFTALTDPATKRQALDLGAYDFLTKPVDPNELVPRIRNALLVKTHLDEMSDQATRLENLVSRRTEELFQSRQQLILSLARAAEHRDNETSNHVLRVGQFAGIIADQLGWNKEQVALIEQAAQLHDVGKIGISDAILFKPGKLDPEEFELMKRHAALGKEIIEPLSEKEFQAVKMHARVGQSILHVRSSPMLMMASRIAQTHHERWDGTGYPLGLAGDDIPIEGRITAVADVFDALSSKRPYKDPFPREKCFQILEEGRRTHFDSRILDAFFTHSEDIVEVQIKFMDYD